MANRFGCRQDHNGRKNFILTGRKTGKSTEMLRSNHGVMNQIPECNTTLALVRSPGLKPIYLNLAFALLAIMIVVLVDILIKMIGLNRFYLVNSYPITILVLFLVLLIVSFLKSRRIFFYSIIIVSLILFCETLYLEYFGRFIPQQQINDIFSDFNEVSLELNHESALILYALIPAVLNFILFMGISRLTIKRATFSFAGSLLLFMQISFAIWVFNYKETINLNPQPIFLNTYLTVIHTLTMYATHELPRSMSMGDRGVEPYLASSPAIGERILPGSRNVIFIMGESLGFDHMSIYGYGRDTTPFLKEMSANRNVVIMEGISSSAKTSITVPYVLNVIKKPDGMKQILSDNTNLYRMAKQNNFTTYYVTPTDIDFLKSFISYMGVKYIDHFIDLYQQENGKELMDEVCADYLEQVDLSRNNFVVLHMRGSHTPYTRRYTKPFARYPVTDELTFRERRLNAYDNSVLYTDYIISKIYHYLKDNTSNPTYLVFTSDHGESLGEDGVYGHLNNTIPVIVRVPIIIISLNNADLSFVDKLKRNAINGGMMNHFEMSKLIGWMLGYEETPESEQHEGYYVNGNRLDGSSGFIKLVFNDRKELIEQASKKLYARSPLMDNTSKKISASTEPVHKDNDHHL